MDTKITPDVFLQVECAARQQSGRLLVLKQMSETDWVLEDPGRRPSLDVVGEPSFRAWVYHCPSPDEPGKHQTIIWPAGHQPQRVALNAFARLGDVQPLRKLGRKCWPKEQHESEGAARAQMRSVTKRGLQKNEQLHPYECPDCGFWHIGHGRGGER